MKWNNPLIVSIIIATLFIVVFCSGYELGVSMNSLRNGEWARLLGFMFAHNGPNISSSTLGPFSLLGQ